MRLTAIEVKLPEPNLPRGRLLAYVSLTLDGLLAIHDCKLIEGKDRIFLDFPKHKLTDRCCCGSKNPVDQRYCGQCGALLGDPAPRYAEGGRRLVHTSTVFPIAGEFRAYLEREVIAAYQAEIDEIGKATNVA